MCPIVKKTEDQMGTMEDIEHNVQGRQNYE